MRVLERAILFLAENIGPQRPPRSTWPVGSANRNAPREKGMLARGFSAFIATLPCVRRELKAFVRHGVRPSGVGKIGVAGGDFQPPEPHRASPDG